MATGHKSGGAIYYEDAHRHVHPGDMHKLTDFAAPGWQQLHDNVFRSSGSSAAGRTSSPSSHARRHSRLRSRSAGGEGSAGSRKRRRVENSGGVRRHTHDEVMEGLTRLADAYYRRGLGMGTNKEVQALVEEVGRSQPGPLPCFLHAMHRDVVSSVDARELAVHFHNSVSRWKMECTTSPTASHSLLTRFMKCLQWSTTPPSSPPMRSNC